MKPEISSVPSTPSSKVARLHYVPDGMFVAESSSGHATVTSFASEGPTAPSPMELVLIALGGCTGSDVFTILQKKRQKITGYDIEVRGERKDTPPRIYTRIEVIHRIRGRAVEEAAVKHAIELSEKKYCSVSAMLSASSEVSMTFEIIEDS